MIIEGIKVFRNYASELIIPSLVLIVVVLIFNIFGETMIEKQNLGE